MAINRTLLLIVIGGLALAHIAASIGESMIRRGALVLDRETVERVYAREQRYASIWKWCETLAGIAIIVGLLKAWGIAGGTGAWGIPTVAVGFGLFCASSVLRAWLCHRAFAVEAPRTQATRGALVAGLLTTLAECAVGFAVCGYLFNPKLFSFSHKPSQVASSTSTSTSTGTGVSPLPTPTPTPAPPTQNPRTFITERDALALLPGKDAQYLRALADQKWIRSEKNGDTRLYHRDDIIKQKAAGLPGPDELKVEPVVKSDEQDKPEKVEP